MRKRRVSEYCMRVSHHIDIIYAPLRPLPVDSPEGCDIELLRPQDARLEQQLVTNCSEVNMFRKL